MVNAFLRLPLLTAFLLLPAAVFADELPVEVAGAYSNTVVSGDQARGYSMRLWKQGYQVFGVFISAAGAAGEGPAGLMDDLRYDPGSKSLSFTAKMSVDRTTLDGENWVPSRDRYRFSGTWFPDQISGSLVHTDALKTDRPARSEEIKLYRSKDEEAAMARPASYAQWWEAVQKILAVRGPKW